MAPENFLKHNKESLLKTGKPYDPRCDFLFLDRSADPKGIPSCSLYRVERRRPDGEGTGEFFDARKLMCKKWPESPADPRYHKVLNFCGYRFLQCDKDGNIFPNQEDALQPGVDISIEGAALEERPPYEIPGLRRGASDKQ
jgi:hypothetical protein